MRPEGFRIAHSLADIRLPHAPGWMEHASGGWLRVFHGTNAGFERFDPGFLGSAVKNETTSIGFFFTNHPEDAEYWADRAVRMRACEPSQRIIPAYLWFARPKVIPMLRYNVLLTQDDADVVARCIRRWRRAGYDGLIIPGDGVVWFAVFDASQIRFALANPA